MHNTPSNYRKEEAVHAVKSDTTLMEEMLMRLQTSNTVIDKLTDGLHAQLNRILGADHNPCKTPGAQPAPTPGLAYQLNSELQTQQELIENLETAIRRLSVL